VVRALIWFAIGTMVALAVTLWVAGPTAEQSLIRAVTVVHETD
jgi:hypothetical protein